MTDLTTVEDQKSLPMLGSEDFRLRPLRLGDEAALLEYLSLPEVIEHTSIPAPTLESLTASVQRRRPPQLTPHQVGSVRLEADPSPAGHYLKLRSEA